MNNSVALDFREWLGGEKKINDYCHDVKTFSSLHRDLQSSLCLWTAPGDWPAEVQDLRTHLCSASGPCFLSEVLDEDPVSMSLATTFCEINTQELEPPAKRRRTLPDGGEDEKFSTYDEIVMKLNGSISDSPVLNLSSLDQIIRWGLN